MMNFLLLAPLKSYTSAGVLLMRLVVGAFLLWGIWDVLPSEARLRGFAIYLAKFHFPLPYLLARLSIYAQAFIAIGFIAGLFTRWAGLLCAVNFTVALVMVDRFGSIHGAFPTASLIAIGIFLALHGSGVYGLDALLEHSAQQRFVRHY
jgi:putative oxidoreductase